MVLMVDNEEFHMERVEKSWIKIVFHRNINPC